MLGGTTSGLCLDVNVEPGRRWIGVDSSGENATYASATVLARSSQFFELSPVFALHRCEHRPGNVGLYFPEAIEVPRPNITRRWKATSQTREGSVAGLPVTGLPFKALQSIPTLLIKSDQLLGTPK